MSCVFGSIEIMVYEAIGDELWLDLMIGIVLYMVLDMLFRRNVKPTCLS